MIPGPGGKNPVVVMNYRNFQMVVRMSLFLGFVAGTVLVGVPWLLYTFL